MLTLSFLRLNANIDEDVRPMPEPTLDDNDFGADINTDDENEIQHA